MMSVSPRLTSESASATVSVMEDIIRGQLGVLALNVRPHWRARVTKTNAAAPTRDAKRAVLVTGTTGALGTYLLATLLLDPSVDEIFALNRHSRSAKVEEGHSRQRAAFENRGIKQELLKSPRLTFIDASRVDDIKSDVISRVCCWDNFFWSPQYIRLTRSAGWNNRFDRASPTLYTTPGLSTTITRLPHSSQ
jgi:Male sterility protein